MAQPGLAGGGGGGGGGDCSGSSDNNNTTTTTTTTCTSTMTTNMIHNNDLNSNNLNATGNGGSGAAAAAYGPTTKTSCCLTSIAPTTGTIGVVVVTNAAEMQPQMPAAETPNQSSDEGNNNNSSNNSNSSSNNNNNNDDLNEVQQLKSGRDVAAAAGSAGPIPLRDEAVYGFAVAARPHGLSSSPANSLGTESLVTPITTPEPSGSPRGDQPGIEPAPVSLPSPVVPNTYDRYMPTPPMVMPPYMAPYTGYFSQPTVYVVHSGAPLPSAQAGFGLQSIHPMQAHAGHHYLHHPLEPVHHPVPYDFSVPPPSFGYIPMGPPPPHPSPHPTHPSLLATHPPPPYTTAGPAVYKISPERFVSLQCTPPIDDSSLGRVAIVPDERVPQAVPAGDMLLTRMPCEPLVELAAHPQELTARDDPPSCIDEQQQHPQLQPQHSADHSVSTSCGELEDEGVSEVTEIIDEMQISDRPVSQQQHGHNESVPVNDEHINQGWCPQCTVHEPNIADGAVAIEDVNNQRLQPKPLSEQPVAESQERHFPKHSGEERSLEHRRSVTPSSGYGNAKSYNQFRHGPDGDYPPMKDEEVYRSGQRDQRRNSRGGGRGDSRDSTRERSGGRFDNHSRRSLTPEKRFRGNAGYGGGNQRDDRRFSNPDHGASHLRTRRGGYDQAPSRDSSTGRRESNVNSNNNNNNHRQRYYPSPRRDGHDRYDNHGKRHDGHLRRGASGPYRGPWREDNPVHASRDELTKPIPRSGNSNMSNGCSGVAGGGGGASNSNSNNSRSGTSGQSGANSRKPPLPRQDYATGTVSTYNGAAHTVVNGITATTTTTIQDVREASSPSVETLLASGEGKTEPSFERCFEDDTPLLEFLGPSLLGMNDRLDVKRMMRTSRQHAVVMDNSSDEGDVHSRDLANGNNNSNNNTTRNSNSGGPNNKPSGHITNVRQVRRSHYRE